jgi:molybdopterin biosynthesis enzyme MoaB
LQQQHQQQMFQQQQQQQRQNHDRQYELQQQQQRELSILQRVEETKANTPGISGGTGVSGANPTGASGISLLQSMFPGVKMSFGAPSPQPSNQQRR